MRVAREPFAPLHLAAEVIELAFREPALEERARVDTGRGVTLEEDLVARAAVVLAAEEVVEAHLVEARRRGVGGEGAPGPRELRVRAPDHGRGVPTDDAADALLHLLVAGERRLLLGRERVDVARLDEPRQAHVELSGALQDPAEQEVGPLAAPRPAPTAPPLHPFARLDPVAVGQRAL